jgi:SAM-dependent methyltransferase
MARSRHIETQAVQGGHSPDPTTLSRGVPVYRTSSFVFKSAKHAAALFSLKEFGNIYSRLGNPTNEILENRITELEGGAASVCAVDASQSAIALARDNADINDLPLSDCEFLCADVFETLRRFEAQGQQFDMIILDPPKLAVSRTDLDRAGRAYKDANMLGLRLLRPGGLLLTFSCSGAVDPATFQKFVSWAALDAGARPVLLRRLGQPADHPVTLEFPEGEYLCGLLLRKDLE